MAKKSNSSKKWTVRRLAPAGLWISGLAILVAGIMLVIKLLTYIGLYTPTSQKPFTLTLWICLGVVLIGLAVYALLDPRRVREFLAGRQARILQGSVPEKRRTQHPNYLGPAHIGFV